MKKFISIIAVLFMLIMPTFARQFCEVYDTKYFTQNLECFHAITFLSTGTKIIKPQELKMTPYFKNY